MAYPKCEHFVPCTQRCQGGVNVGRYLTPMWDVQVSTELIRMAILWHEMWHEALEEASRQYFGESNVEAMLNTLMPLHEMMAHNGPTTLKEIAFVQVRPLLQATSCVCNLYAVASSRACACFCRGTRGLASEPPVCVPLHAHAVAQGAGI